jgi:hypothetical protein
MNFAITWLFDKMGFMPKIDMQVGKVNLDVEPPKFEMWPFPIEEKKRPEVKKATTRKPAVKKTVAKKATTVAKKAK